MNKQKINGIEWTDYTWNPVTGCKHGCDYCYARRIAHRFFGDFEPRFYPERLDEPLKKQKPSKIFVVDMGDLFGAWVPDEWINEVLLRAALAHGHTFQYLTKNPERMLDFEFPENSWAGTTITRQEDLRRADIIKQVQAPVHWLSIEPLLGQIDYDFSGIDWIVVGAQTGPGATLCEAEWVEAIRESGIPTFTKHSLEGVVPLVRQYPEIYASIK